MNRPTAAQKRHFEKLAELGCIICSGPAEIHHCFTGMGSKKNHDNVIPLCPMHHRTGGYGIAIHPNKKAFASNFGSEQELLEKCHELLNESTV